MARVIYKFNKRTGTWVACSGGQLGYGDLFKMYDNGIRYANKETGDNVWVAKGCSYVNADGITGVKTLY